MPLKILAQDDCQFVDLWYCTFHVHKTKCTIFFNSTGAINVQYFIRYGDQFIKTVTRQQWISEAAYYKAEARHFAPGKALDDWLVAENDYVKMEIAHYLSVAEEDGGITILSLQQLAKELGVDDPESIHQKIELIQSIQAASQHRPCFRSISEKDCHEEDCQWRAECKKMIAAWCRY